MEARAPKTQATPEGPTDATLVRQALSGAREGYAGLVDRHLPALVGFLRYLNAPPPLVDDLVQEAFTKAFQHLAEYDQQRSFTTWLFSIAKNTFYDHCRRHNREQKLLESQNHPPQLSDGVEEGAVKRRTLEELLASLSEEEKLLIQMRIYQDLPFGEIAQTLGDSEGALRVRFHRILKTLRVAAGKEGIHEA